MSQEAREHDSDVIQTSSALALTFSAVTLGVLTSTRVDVC